MKSNHIVYLKLICFNVKLPIKFERKRELKVKKNTDRFIFFDKVFHLSVQNRPSSCELYNGAVAKDKESLIL